MPGRKIRLTSGSSLIIIGTSLGSATSKNIKGNIGYIEFKMLILILIPASSATKRHHHHHHHSSKSPKAFSTPAILHDDNG
jgi:hypothetical protein